MDYLMLASAALLLAVNFAITKAYQKINGASPKSAFGFNSLLGLLSAIVFFAISGFKFKFSWFSFIMCSLQHIFVLSYNVLGFKLLKLGSMALYTLFLMTGGMTLPYLYGLLFLNEPFSWLRMAGLVVILIGVILSNFNGGKTNVKMLLLCIAVFILNGFTSITLKLHQIETIYETVNTTQFVMLGGILNFIVAGVLFLITKKDETEQIHTIQHAKLYSVLLIAVSVIASGVSSTLQLWGAAMLPATVLYPFITGGSIVFSTIAGVVLFKDKLSLKIILSVILCFAGTLMFL